MNDTTMKTTLAEAMEQIGYSMSWLVHGVAEVSDNHPIFMAMYELRMAFGN